MKTIKNMLIFIILISLIGIGSAAYSHSQTFAVTSDEDLTSHQIKIILSNASASSTATTIYTGGITQNDWDDIRFYYTTSGVDSGTLVPYWFDYRNQTASTITAYLKMPHIYADDTAGFKMVYGDAGVTSGMSGSNTFEYFDDFTTDTSSSYTAFGTGATMAYNASVKCLTQTNNTSTYKWITANTNPSLTEYTYEVRLLTTGDAFARNYAGAATDLTTSTPVSGYTNGHIDSSLMQSLWTSNSYTVKGTISDNGAYADDRWVLYKNDRDRSNGILSETMFGGGYISSNTISDSTYTTGSIVGAYSYGCKQYIDDIRVMKYSDATIALDDISEVTTPTAAFSGTPTTGSVPLTVTFTDSSTNTPTSWAWNFGDGNTSSIHNPTHVYYTPSTAYTVTLTATNAAGSDSEVKTSYITTSVPDYPVASFTHTSPTALQIQFNDTSSPAATSWNWSFGDGTYSNGQDPLHVYSAVGIFTVTLTATNAFGSSSNSASVHSDGQDGSSNLTLTGDRLVILNDSESHSFNFTSDIVLNNTIFFINGVQMNVTGNELVTSFNGGRYYNVTAYGVSADGIYSAPVVWRVTVHRAVATTHIESFEDDNYENFMDNFTNFNSSGMAENAVVPFTDLIGRSFYLILFVMPYGLMWMKQRRMTIPVVMALITGCLIIGFIPTQYLNVLIYAIILTVAVNLYFVGRESR